MEDDDMIQYERDQDDEPVGRDQKQLTFEQQKAELKRKILAQPAKK